MSALLLIVLVGVAVVLTVRSARRGLSDRHTVEEHHRTLDTLAEIAQHHEPPTGPTAEPTSDRPHVRVVPPGQDRSTGSAEPVRWPIIPPLQPVVPPPVQPVVEVPPPVAPPPPQPVAATPQAAAPPPQPVAEPAVTAAPPARPSPDDWPALVFDDLDDPVTPVQGSRPVAAARGEVPTLSAPITPPPPPTRPAPRPPEPAAPLVASTLGEGRLATKTKTKTKSRSRSRTKHGRGWPRGAIAGLSAAATIAVVVGGAAIATSLNKHGGHHPPPAASPQAPPVLPTTTVPKASAVLIDSNSQGARYSVAPPAASIELVPTSSCWVQVRTGSANGTVVFQDTMHAGDHVPLPTSGPVWLRLGNPPAVTIVVNGTPLHLATPSVAQPYNLEFQPAG